MSVILDALRKSEHERQRSAVPGLAQIPTATTRTELPRWALVVIGMLGVAVLVLGGAWLQSLRSGTQDPHIVSRALEIPPPTAPTTVPVALPAAAFAPIPAPAAAPPNAAPRETSAPSTPSRAATTSSQSLADVAASTARTATPSEPPPSAADATTATATTPPATAAPAAAGAVAEPTLPSAAALMARGVSLPPLKLELHAYAPEPAARFVFINGRKYVEGQRLAEGPEVAAIAPNGAVLIYLGQRFILTPE